ncbi:histidine phosphatase superfamily [Pelagophyceae sp. CCMP2097]|nr:histidine phosphatase superfamily [Pelagophyceae sp. CCMP2097]
MGLRLLGSFAALTAALLLGAAEQGAALGRAQGAALPPYCGVRGSNVADLAAPSEPGLSLVAVQVFIRHGARTPAAPCGDVLATPGKWDCNEAFNEAPAFEEASNASRWRFRRSYRGSQNVMGGTCESGQLLDEGYQQHAELGTQLRKAYRQNGRVASIEGPLGDSNTAESGEAEMVRGRSTDLSRTRASMESLLQNFLGETSGGIMTIQTLDFATDTLYPNVKACPRLAALEKAAWADPDFIQWNSTSPEKIKLDADLAQALGGLRYGLEMAGGHLFDCVMSATCEGRANELLPRTLTAEMRDELVRQAEHREYWKLHFNDKAYAKLTAQPLIAASMAFAKEAIESSKAANFKVPNFKVWSAHDTSVMPLQVALGTEDGKWAPYAHAVVLEVWRRGEEAFVRLSSDGRVRVASGCASELCPYADFVAATQWANAPRDCDAPHMPTPQVVSGASRDAFGDAFGVVSLAAVLSFGLGAAVAAYLARRKAPPSYAVL